MYVRCMSTYAALTGGDTAESELYVVGRFPALGGLY